MSTGEEVNIVSGIHGIEQMVGMVMMVKGEETNT